MNTRMIVGPALCTLALVASPSSAQTSARTNARDSVRITSPIARGDSAMNIIRAGSRPSAKGPADWFTGTVRIDPVFDARPPARAAGATVTFEPGARTAWHRHPLGQTLIVLFGRGLVQREGHPVEEIRPGDVVLIEPNERHWHGAGPNTAMQHIAIQEALDGKVVEWLEQVSDEQYGAFRGGRGSP